MRKSLRTRLLICIAGVVAVLTLATGIAMAASFTSATSLTLSGPDHARAGHAVKLEGRLKSSNPRCRAFKHITLIVDGQAVNGGDETDRLGFYTIYHGFASPGTYTVHTHFRGTVHGRHPNRRVCLASNSDPMTVHITHRH
jgi:hypothetical protein